MRPNQDIDAHSILLAASSAHGFGIYLGGGAYGPVFAEPERCTLVLGPPRSGKTSSVVVPNVLAFPGGVAAVSTKADVMERTAGARRRIGPCALFDPGGLTKAPEGVTRVGWSPLRAALDWEGALLVTDAMVGAARPERQSAESAHWSERSAALLAPILHSAALDGSPLSRVVADVNRREPERALGVLARSGAELPLDILTGITATEPREQSGIWSSVAGVLSAYRSRAALESADLARLDPADLIEGSATLYVVASSEQQHLAGPLIAGLLRDVRSAAYRAHPGHLERPRPPVLLVLDELANIAPLHDLPTLVSEGASQGVLTLACLQDLAQARARWGVGADGFFSLFGSKLVLGGLGDVRTLEAVSLLAGERDIPVLSRPVGARSALSRRSGRTQSTRRARRLDPDKVASPPAGMATVLSGTRVDRVELTPFYSHSPWREAAFGQAPGRRDHRSGVTEPRADRGSFGRSR